MNTWIWSELGLADVLDIALMSFLIYQAIRVLRGTRAFQSMLGLLALVLLYLASERLGLSTIRWLLDKLFVYIVLAVIILFQRDIRRGLAGAGGRLFPRFATATDLSMLEDLVKASFSLASRRMGAIVVIERDATLDAWLEPASGLDARVSQDLLLAIFHPTSPLHDGAVIIQKGRVAAAKVFLPLSQSRSVSRMMGTRHRAALGLTEETDAVVIVVSEERGTVSVVQEGRITPCRDANELRSRLQTILQPRASGPAASSEPAGS